MTVLADILEYAFSNRGLSGSLIHSGQNGFSHANSECC